MDVVHVVTVAPNLPAAVFDKVMTATEQALVELGATRVWIDGSRPAFAVMAELAPLDRDDAVSATATEARPA